LVTRGRLQPYEIVSPVPRRAAQRPAERLPDDEIRTVGGAYRLDISPAKAFAWAALAVSLLALSYQIGRRNPIEPSQRTSATTESPQLEAVRNLAPIPFEELTVYRAAGK